MSIHVVRLGQDLDQRVLVPHQIVEPREGRLRELDNHPMCGSAMAAGYAVSRAVQEEGRLGGGLIGYQNVKADGHEPL